MTSAPSSKAALNRSWLIASLREQRPIIVEHIVGAVDLLAELRIEHARRVQIGVRAIIEPGQRSDPVRRIDRHDALRCRSAAIFAGVMILLQRAVIGIDQGKRADLLVGAEREDDRFGQIAVEHLVARERLGEARIVDRRSLANSRQGRRSSSPSRLRRARLRGRSSLRATWTVFSSIPRARSENQNSRPLWNSTEAKIATSTVGTAAITENSATSRVCSRPLPSPPCSARAIATLRE